MKFLAKSFLIIICAAVILLSGCSTETGSRIPVVVTTAMMQTAAQIIGGEHVEVTVLIPPGSCPGHYDIRPGDVHSIQNSKAFFAHDYEQVVPKLTESAGDSAPPVFRIESDGNWLLPNVYLKSAEKVAELLSEIDSANADEYQANFENLKAKIADVEREIRASIDAAGIEGAPVICSEQQAAVLKWIGLDVVGTYGRPEEFTPTMIHELVKLGREKEVRLAADNLQSGPTAGRQLAEEIGAAHITLSNFPGGLPNTPTWESCLRANVELVITALQSEG